MSLRNELKLSKQCTAVFKTNNASYTELFQNTAFQMINNYKLYLLQLMRQTERTGDMIRHFLAAFEFSTVAPGLIKR